MIKQNSITNKEIIAIALPIIFGNLAQTIITFIDTAFLGHLGMIELGASMLAGIYYFVFSTLAMGFATGIQIIIARRYGERNYSQIGTVFQHGLLFVLLLSIFLFLLLHFASASLLKHIITSPNVYASAMDFIQYRHYGIIIVCFNFLFRSLYIGISKTRIIMFTTLLMAVVNILFDYLFIFGNCGFPAIGVRGAAIASVLAELSALILFVVYTLCRLPVKQYFNGIINKIDKILFQTIFKLSLPCMLQRLFSFGIWFVFFALIESTGEENIAITGIVRSVYMLLLVPVFGFGATANTLTARLIGENKTHEIGKTLLKIIKMCLAVVIPLVVVVMIIPDKIAAIYTRDAFLASASIPVIYVVAVAAIIMSAAITCFESVSGTGNTTVALLLEMGILFIYIAFVFLSTQIIHAKIEWIWCAEIVYATLLTLFSYLYLRHTNWKSKKL